MSHAERVRFAWKIALNNIAEEISRCALRHGVDSRDFSLVAFGSAGPDAAGGVLDLVKARRLIVPPHPGLFSAIGLLSTDFVYANSRSQYQMLLPDTGRTDRGHISPALRHSCARASALRQVIVRRSFDGRLAGQSWETPFINVDAAALKNRGPAALIDEFHAEYARRNGVAFPQIPVQARDLARADDRADREAVVAAPAGRTRQTNPGRGAHAALPGGARTRSAGVPTRRIGRGAYPGRTCADCRTTGDHTGDAGPARADRSGR